jgi:Helicase HerA, central domain
MAEMSAADYEKLGLFYLGKHFDLDKGTRLNDLVLYDSRDLLTHAVVVGMTGSGKTGLGISLIEEAAIDGIPVLAIDPKGDLGNLLLTFPDLAAADFAPWIDAGEAQRHNTTVDAYAAETAQRWKAGLAEWDQDGARIARLKAAADVTVYTPGSRIGTPLAILGSLGFAVTDPGEEAQSDIATTASSLLGLAGLDDVQPHSREQALVSAILSSRPPNAPADLRWLVQQIQRPSFDSIGVLDLETFFPARERQELALRFNSVLAAPGFDAWSAGEPLDAASLLFTPAGKPRIAIISVAHLDDAQRMMVVSLVLNAVLRWTRRQSGTSSLRALVYMDEMFGYLPPVANPLSKLPLLTLLKQARAFGVGLVLATQNPVDLDYKALSNTGTWFLGKLQTERDKARMLDGLEGVSSGLDRQAIDRALSSLRSRVFLMHNVHEQAPIAFETRWALSYLRGPMGREELRRFARAPETSTATAAPPPIPTPAVPTPATSTTKPIVPAGIEEYVLPSDSGSPAVYAPVLYGAARVQYTDTKRGIDVTRSVHVIVSFSSGPIPVDWERAEETPHPPERLTPPSASAAAPHQPLPPAALDKKRYAAWTKGFGQWLARAQPLKVFTVPSMKLVSKPGESVRDFQARIQLAGRETRDAAVEKLRERYAPKLARLQAKARKAEEAVGKEQQQASQQKLQTAVSFGATMLGALMGRRAVSLSTLGRATTAARGVGRSAKETEDVAKAQARLQEAQAELAALEAELQQEVAALEGATPGGVAVETIEIKPKRGGVDVRIVALAWKPIPS